MSELDHGRAERDRRPEGVDDTTVEEAARLLRDAGHPKLAQDLESDVVGRNVLAGRWTFQVVEEFEDGYYLPVCVAEERVRDELMAGRRHVYESELKRRRRTPGRDGH